MNPIANKKEAEILDYLSNDIEEAVDTPACYCEQQKGIKTLFDMRSLNIIGEKNFLKDLLYFNIFSNSFSQERGNMQECIKISLTSKDR